MVKELVFADLKLLPGTKLDLRSDQYSALKGVSNFVGFQGNNIVITTPVVGSKPIACRPNTQVTLRFFVNHLNSVCAFRSDITHTATAPFHHLFIAAPKVIEVGEVRSSVRVHAKLPCKVTSTAEFRKANQLGTLNNLSIEGAKVLSKNFIGDEGEEVKVTTKINVLDMEEVVHIRGFIRSSANAEKQFVYGIEFFDVDSTTKLLIYSYVMSQML